MSLRLHAPSIALAGLTLLVCSLIASQPSRALPSTDSGHPWSAFSHDNRWLPADSLRLSQLTQYPILSLPVNVDHNQFKHWLEQIHWPNQALPEAIKQQYLQALQPRRRGFAIRPAPFGSPCLISVAGSYQDHVDTEQLLSLVTGYRYHPYWQQPVIYEQMVKYHELGHCFEDEVPLKAEAFADLFAALMLAREYGNWRHLHHELLPLRLLELANGDISHFSLPVLLPLVKHPKLPQQLQNFSVPEIVELTHWRLQQTTELTPDHFTTLRQQVQLMTLGLAIQADQQLMQDIPHPLSDAAEAYYEQLLLRHHHHQQRFDILQQQTSSIRGQQLHQLLMTLAQAMYHVRDKRGELDNNLQQQSFQFHVDDLFRATSHSFPLHPLRDDFSHWQSLLAKQSAIKEP